VYPYLDISHHGRLGWDEDRIPTGQVLLQAARASGSTPGRVHGFIANTADYSVLREPYFGVNDVVYGQPVHQSRWVDWNTFVDEVPYVQAFRAELVGLGFDPGISMLIDTSRNGWGGPGRPAGPAPKTTLDGYVDGSRLDRRFRVYYWCNQAGAGLGERPAASPEPGIDAYVWAKPPGESDGAGVPVPGADENADPTCDPAYGGRPDSTPDPSGALPNAPLPGRWFAAQFQQLLQNAWPPL
jgi:cellulose 1,4-beta-cellobiosidase